MFYLDYFTNNLKYYKCIRDTIVKFNGRISMNLITTGKVQNLVLTPNKILLFGQDYLSNPQYVYM